jgi:hypothetical protein
MFGASNLLAEFPGARTSESSSTTTFEGLSSKIGSGIIMFNSGLVLGIVGKISRVGARESGSGRGDNTHISSSEHAEAPSDDLLKDESPACALPA